MRKHTESKVPRSFWHTPAGEPLYHNLHDDGWEALDMLNSVTSALNKAIEATADEAIKAELKKARVKVLESANAYRRATAILNDYDF